MTMDGRGLLGGPSPVAGEDPLEGVTEADPAELAVLAGAALGSAMITVGVERWLFRRGEGRRAQGVHFAHTRQGLALGALEAGLTALTFGAGAVREKLRRADLPSRANEAGAR